MHVCMVRARDHDMHAYKKQWSSDIGIVVIRRRVVVARCRLHGVQQRLHTGYHSTPSPSPPLSHSTTPSLSLSHSLTLPSIPSPLSLNLSHSHSHCCPPYHPLTSLIQRP